MKRQVHQGLLLGVLLSLLFGCGEPTPINFTLQSVDEPLWGSDVATFLEVVECLPEPRLKDIPTPLAVPPDWEAERTLPVRDLVNDELTALERRWALEPILKRLPKTKAFARCLKRKHITPERFASLAMAVGAALSRSSIPPEIDVEAHLKKAELIVSALRKDGRPFHTLSPEVSHEIHQRAAWITEFHRAGWLAGVPESNVAAVKRYRDRLADSMPAEYFTSPLNDRLDDRQELALPFTDLPGNEHLELLTWDPANAIIGTAKTN